MNYDFEFHPYQRRFRQPLQTAYGSWEVREGIILRLTDETDRKGWGEIAPLPWFGSETLEQALKYCQQLQGKITQREIEEISENLPACQFGFESALENLCTEKASVAETDKEKTNYCYLLPAGETVLEAWKSIATTKRSPLTFKWKIGVNELLEEVNLFKQLARQLPEGTRLRLDANGGLSWEQAKVWLEVAEETRIVEFLEQPLPPSQFDRLLALSSQYCTAIALDESVATLNDLEACYQKGWRGVYVIKAAIAGSPKRLRQLCRQYRLDAVFSSVFETAIGTEAVLRLAAELANPHRAIGFGVSHWFV
jgi:o-succinylbenzoate synthase